MQPITGKTPRPLKYLIGFALIVLCVYVLLSFLSDPVADHPYFNPDKFVVIAHRGGRSLGPESTLVAFQRASEVGVDVIEIDVHRTADGHLVIIHDHTVDRTTNGSGPVNDFRLRELQALDAAYRWSPDKGRTYPLRGKGIAIPTLAEAFTAMPAMRMNIEIKESRPEVIAPLCDLIRDFNKTDQVMIASFDASQLKRFRSRCPEVATSAGAREAFVFYGVQWAHLENIYTPPAQALQVPEKYGRIQVITPRFLRAAHARNLRVHVWTVNDPQQMQRLVDLGVDGIMTDYPQRLIALLGRSKN
jgi:glycerophosphoryl diester phosphodiesterase